MVRARTFDQVAAGLIPGWGAIKSPQPSINQVPALLAGVKMGCVRLCRVASNTV